MSRFIVKILLFVAFPAAIFCGGLMLADYSYRPGPSGIVVQDLNSIDALQSATGRFQAMHAGPTLIVFYHPHCPCSIASIHCLERLSTKFSASPNILAFGYCPATKPDSWIESANTNLLRAIPGLQIVIDREAEFCKRFGVVTSGHTLLYDEAGNLIFSGGITPGRGHEGDSRAGLDLLEKINGLNHTNQHWPVFGCPIVAGEVDK